VWGGGTLRHQRRENITWESPLNSDKPEGEGGWELIPKETKRTVLLLLERDVGRAKESDSSDVEEDRGEN